MALVTICDICKQQIKGDMQIGLPERSLRISQGRVLEETWQCRSMDVCHVCAMKIIDAVDGIVKLNIRRSEL